MWEKNGNTGKNWVVRKGAGILGHAEHEKGQTCVVKQGEKTDQKENAVIRLKRGNPATNL